MCLLRLSSLGIASGCMLDGLSLAFKIPFNLQAALIFPSIPAVARACAFAIPKLLGDSQSRSHGDPQCSAI